MQLPQIFDASKVEPSSGFPPPPVLADYHVRIIESEMKPTKDNPNAGYLELTLEILDPGPYQGRKVPDRLNVFNPNPQTVEIAYKQLSAYCHVTGVFQVQDSRQLHNIPFIANIGPQNNNPQFANVFQVKDINGNVPGKSAAAGPPPTAAQPPAQQPPAAAAPPWGPPAQPPAAAPAPAWGPPAVPAAPAAPAWQQPAAAPAAPAPAAPPWGPPQAGAPAAAAPPPWANR